MVNPSARVLPAFDPRGCLPAGTYALTIAELRFSHLVMPPGPEYPRWNTGWRRRLVDNLAILTEQLARVGITEVFVAGSFVEDKDHPNDIDGYFPFAGGPAKLADLVHALNDLDPHECWGWDPAQRKRYRGYPKAQLPMWHAYRVELYPDYGQPSGLCDREGRPLDFPAAFRLSRDGHPRGVISLEELGGAP